MPLFSIYFDISSIIRTAFGNLNKIAIAFVIDMSKNIYGIVFNYVYIRFCGCFDNLVRRLFSEFVCGVIFNHYIVKIVKAFVFKHLVYSAQINIEILQIA